MQTNEEGRYIYGIMNIDHSLDLGPYGIGGREDRVYTVNYRDIAAIVSQSPIIDFAISRENITAHAQVLEKAAAQGPVLPVRFCTIAGNEALITEKVLQPHYQEFVEKLQAVGGKIELGVKVHWRNIDAVYAEVVAENEEIKALKDELEQETNEQAKYAGSIKVGQLVQQSLEEKKKREAESLLGELKPESAGTLENPVYGDTNFVNAAFLVDKKNEGRFDEKVNAIRNANGGRILVKYSASPVPYNFAEITIR